MKRSLHQLLVLGKEKYVGQQFPDSLPGGDRIDPVLRALGQKIKGRDRGGNIFAELGEFPGKWSPISHVTEILFLYILPNVFPNVGNFVGKERRVRGSESGNRCLPCPRNSSKQERLPV